MSVEDRNTGGLARRSNLILALKHRLGNNAFRAISQPVAAVLRCVPPGILYDTGAYFRQGKPPYSVLIEGSVAVQVGVPRDLLRIGRSRTIYFLRLVGASGKVVVFEPDADSAAALRTFAAKAGLSDRLHVVEKAAWSEPTTLSFRISDLHPASNLVEGIDVPPEEAARRAYRTVRVPASTIDAEITRLGIVPTLVSITANGSERATLDGMQETISEHRPFVSLAFTGPEYPETMRALGYRLMAPDDRGFTFAPVERASSLTAQKKPTGKYRR